MSADFVIHTLATLDYFAQSRVPCNWELFLFVHVHSTFYRKVGIQRTGVERGGARVNTGLHNKTTETIENVEGCRDGSAKKYRNKGTCMQKNRG